MALDCLDVSQSLQFFSYRASEQDASQKSHSAVVNTKPLLEKIVSTAQRKRVFGRWGDFTVTPHSIN
jgi:hypothetical protein